MPGGPSSCRNCASQYHKKYRQQAALNHPHHGAVATRAHDHSRTVMLHAVVAPSTSRHMGIFANYSCISLLKIEALCNSSSTGSGAVMNPRHNRISHPTGWALACPPKCPNSGRPGQSSPWGSPVPQTHCQLWYGSACTVQHACQTATRTRDDGGRGPPTAVNGATSTTAGKCCCKRWRNAG
jgi:hypothetical protein